MLANATIGRVDAAGVRVQAERLIVRDVHTGAQLILPLGFLTAAQQDGTHGREAPHSHVQHSRWKRRFGEVRNADAAARHARSLWVLVDAVQPPDRYERA